MRNNVLFVHDKEIKRMSIGWRFYHLFKEPPHKYKGKIILEKNVLKLRSGNKKWCIPYEKIKDLHLGFDEIFKRRMSVFKPLRIKYQTDGKKATIYLFVNFHAAAYFAFTVLWWIPKTKNKELFSALKRNVAFSINGSTNW